MTVLDERDRAALHDADSAVSTLQAVFEVDACDGGLRRFAQAFDDIAVDRSALRGGPRPHASAGSRDRASIEPEAVRHLVRDPLDEQPPVDLRDEGATIRTLETWLPGLTVTELSELTGVSVRQLQRRRREGGGVSSARLELVARLVAILRHGWTDRGVLAWFARMRTELDGKAPMELLNDPGRERDMLLLARAGRVHGAG